jgi:squalene-hopene/tetraprenyl-beta-curcumene cyclase
MVALEEAGVAPDHTALVKAADWILSKQILGPGDWQVKNKDAEPGGWAFEFRNDYYPDVDDTAFVLMALQRVKFPDEKRMEGAVRRGIQWLLSMQNRDGGWGAFDRDNDRKLLCNIPFADHNAMIDPSTADVTARVLECLGRFGWSADHPAVKRGVEFLLKDQCRDGSWFGRWGVNYVYGTSGVLRALETFSLNAQGYARRAVNWLKAVQKPDGSFGESLRSYHVESSKGQGSSTPSQTAWGLIGLLAAAEPGDPAIGGPQSRWCGNRTTTARGMKTTSPAPASVRLLPEVSPVPQFLPGIRAGALLQASAKCRWAGILRPQVPPGRVPDAQRFLKRE